MVLPNLVVPQPLTPQAVLQDRSTILTSSWTCSFDPYRLRHFQLSKELRFCVFGHSLHKIFRVYYEILKSNTMPATLCLQNHCLSSEIVSLTKTRHNLSAHRPFGYRPRGTVNIHYDEGLFRLGSPLVFVPRFRHEVNESGHS